MGELGSEARSYHQEVGEFAKRLKLNTLLSLGVLSQAASDAFAKENHNDEQSQHFNQRSALMAHLFSLLDQQLSVGQQDIAILVKGSRSAHMEHVVTEIIEWFAQMKVQQDVNQSVSQKSVTSKNQASKNQSSDNQSKEGMA
jgi:UDP-N-acetylmuramoyl-tripeptide--D-alanyl-D-alanine ligase